MKQEKTLFDPIENLIELAKNQSDIIQLANEIIEGKNRMIELCEMETEMYKRQSKRLTTYVIISLIIFTVLAVLNLTRLLL
jgi:hypothetical protein